MQDETGTPLTPSARPTTAPAQDHVQGRSRLFALLIGLGLLTLALDQGSKVWALASLTPGEPRDLLGSFVRLNLIRNAGAAFSLGDGVTWLLTLLALGIVVWVARAARQVGHRGWAVTLGMLLGGAIGNLVDRIFRAPGLGRGHVVDFIDYFGLFIGNVADIAIVVAAALGGILALRGIPLDGVRPGRHEAHPAGPVTDSASDSPTDDSIPSARQSGTDTPTTNGDHV
ncbi:MULTISPECIES: signal peptidase II [unclassified Knoellia]|uniref:signal peptidase II n=1 Tax=Knoellia altitudinis TaxID=3404795 RepID=UPI003619F963